MSIELAAHAVVPITCRKDRPVSFFADFPLVTAPAGLADIVVLLKGDVDGVLSLAQGALTRGFAGVVVAMLSQNTHS